jgi:hypothetical protein
LNKKKLGRLASSQLDRVGRDIAVTEAKRDKLVYELNGLTEEEVGSIEELTSES